MSGGRGTEWPPGVYFDIHAESSGDLFLVFTAVFERDAACEEDPAPGSSEVLPKWLKGGGVVGIHFFITQPRDSVPQQLYGLQGKGEGRGLGKLLRGGRKQLGVAGLLKTFTTW